MATAHEVTQLAAVLAQLAKTLAETQAEPEPPTTRTMPDRVLLTVEEAAERLGIGRTFLFKLVGAGEIQSVQIGRLRRIPASEIQNYADRLLTSTRTNAA